MESLITRMIALMFQAWPSSMAVLILTVTEYQTTRMNVRIPLPVVRLTQKDARLIQMVTA